VPYAEAARNRLALKHQLKEAVQGIDRGIFGVQVRVLTYMYTWTLLGVHCWQLPLNASQVSVVFVKQQDGSALRR
jgi:hypothetical protein